MKFKKIVGIGDSWTFGEGSVNLSDKEAQKLQSDTSETVLNVSKKYYDKVTKHSWVKKLSDLYDCDYKVIAVPGCSNESIMMNFYSHKEEFNSETLVVIMWSSKFRDKILALPNFKDRWMFRSEDMILSEQMHHKWIDIGGDDYWKWFKKYFITDLFDEEILNYYTTIYKIFVQKYCEKNNIPYIMCNAFEACTSENKLIPIDKLDKKYYYNFDLSLFDDLKVINKPLFENDVNLYGKDYKNGLHPNSLGYDIIAKTLKDFIDVVHSK